ncbi:MAG: hypothetical protein U1F19_06640 [Lysobacterales bacterium]
MADIFAQLAVHQRGEEVLAQAPPARQQRMTLIAPVERAGIVEARLLFIAEGLPTGRIGLAPAATFFCLAAEGREEKYSRQGSGTYRNTGARRA